MTDLRLADEDIERIAVRVAQLVHPPKANLTIAETAVRLALSERTVRNLIKQGRLRAVRVSPKRLAVTPREVDAYVAARRR